MRTLIVLIMLSGTAQAQKIDNYTLRHFGAGVAVGGAVASLTHGTDDSRLLKAVGVTMGVTIIHGIVTKRSDLSGVITSGTGAIIGGFITNLIRKRRVCRL